MRFIRYLATAAAILAAIAAPAGAQQGPQRPTNLQVLPDTISRDELIGIMRNFSLALGVRCSHCHVEREVDGGVGRDMASDAKVEKRIAREMLRMAIDINTRLETLPERADPPVRVHCATCHRGATTPRLLGDTLMVAYERGGADSLVATYRVLRDRHHGRGTYDFGDRPLADLGANLLSEGMAADATAVARLNVEMNPQSAVAAHELARAQLAHGDSAAARESYRRVLELEPGHRDAAAALERIGGAGRTP